MHTVSPTFHRHLLGTGAIGAADARVLVDAARAFKRHATDPPQRLRGKNIALLCGEPVRDCARRFDAAASALGARVAHIEPAAAWLRDDPPIGEQTARLLESLYDAVDCEDLPVEFARRLQAQLSVPVYDGLAREDHPLFGLLSRVAEGSQPPGEDDRRALLQAALVGTLL
jgi:ornithine carbamoyltransferase